MEGEGEVRPGGYVVAMTSSGTSVTSDILILKKRETPLNITHDKNGEI